MAEIETSETPETKVEGGADAQVIQETAAVEEAPPAVEAAVETAAVETAAVEIAAAVEAVAAVEPVAVETAVAEAAPAPAVEVVPE